MSSAFADCDDDDVDHVDDAIPQCSDHDADVDDDEDHKVVQLCDDGFHTFLR